MMYILTVINIAILIVFITLVTGNFTRKFWAWITRGTPVILESEFDEQFYLTIAYPHPYHKEIMCANVYWKTQVGKVNLHPSGACSGSSIYIKKWYKG